MDLQIYDRGSAHAYTFKRLRGDRANRFMFQTRTMAS